MGSGDLRNAQGTRSGGRAAAGARQAGFDHLSSATRWVATATLGLIGVVSTLVAHDLPGHTSKSTGSTGSTGSQSAGQPASAQGGGGLQPAPVTPSAAPLATPQVVSGGS